MISYLSEVFEKVYVSNIYEDADLIQNLDEILEKYNIEYVIWAQDVAETGNMSHMMALNPLLKEGGMSDVRTDVYEKNWKCRQASHMRKYRKNAISDHWNSACFCRS